MINAGWIKKLILAENSTDYLDFIASSFSLQKVDISDPKSSLWARSLEQDLKVVPRAHFDAMQAIKGRPYNSK